MSGLIKRLKEERIQGSSAVLNYSNFDYWVNWDDIVDIVEDHDQPQLNENQQIVLEWLKDYYDNSKWSFPFYVVMHAVHEMPASTFGFYDDFTKEEEFEVLAAFAQWGREQEEE